MIEEINERSASEELGLASQLQQLQDTLLKGTLGINAAARVLAEAGDQAGVLQAINLSSLGVREVLGLQGFAKDYQGGVEELQSRLALASGVAVLEVLPSDTRGIEGTVVAKPEVRVKPADAHFEASGEGLVKGRAGRKSRESFPVQFTTEFAPRLVKVIKKEPVVKTSYGSIIDIGGGRTMNVTKVPFEIDETGNGFHYQTLDEAVPIIYADLLEDMTTKTNPNNKLSAYRSFTYEYYYTGALRLRELAKVGLQAVDPDTIPNIRQLIEWVRKHKLYRDLTLDNLCQVYERRISFAELLAKSGLGKEKEPRMGSTRLKDPRKDEFLNLQPYQCKLTPPEIYLLAKSLSEKGEAMGLFKDPSEQSAAEKVLEVLGSQYQTVRSAVYSIPTLRVKLEVYIDKHLNRQRDAFLANTGNVLAQSLLSTIENLDKEQLVELLNVDK